MHKQRKSFLKYIIILIFFTSYILILFPFPFSNLNKSYLYNNIGYHYVNNIVMPDYAFYKCNKQLSIDWCNKQKKFNSWETKVEINEFGGRWNIKDFVKKTRTYPFVDIDLKELKTINESIQDSGANHYYIIVSSAGFGDEGRKVINFAIIIFFIVVNYLSFTTITFLFRKFNK